mmetsp:Transcript_26634/g.61290  ORF Transcript_26634/g.61290 Transcript_26634/m.61290 type:complete len:259 (-) Transcript_26634:374-1150(-)
MKEKNRNQTRRNTKYKTTKSSLTMKFGTDIVKDDILELNVGGESFMVRRSTMLLAPEDSHLHAMFSGRWDDSLLRDAQGKIFLDITPCVFGAVLSYLRATQLGQPSRNRRILRIQPQYEEELRAVCDYFNIFGSHLYPIFMKPVCGGIDVQDNVITHARKIDGFSPVISLENIGVGSYWKVKIISLKFFLFAGIIATDDLEGESYTMPSSFGWASKGFVYSDGQMRGSVGGWNRSWKAGDEAIFKLEQKKSQDVSQTM